jgi:threonine/homoserine/homoserine lactone efflux protein
LDGLVEPVAVLSFAIACVVLNLVPGPGMLFITAHGIAGGRRAGIAAAAGMASGTVGHTVAATLGLSALLYAAPFALDVVRVVGAVVLLYLAVNALRTASTTAQAGLEGGRSRSLRRTYAMAVLTNLGNPKVVLFYLVFVPQFLTTGPGGWPFTAQMLVLGAVLIAIGLVMDCAIGVAAGTFSVLLMGRPAVQRWLKRISAAVFGGLAIRLLLGEVH